MIVKKSIAATCAAAAIAVSGAACVPAQAAPVVTGGLVNITIVDVLSGNQVQAYVAIPIAVAANICDTTVAILATDLRDGSADCDALAAQEGTVTFAPQRR
jgi:hypothetical protein